MYNINISEYFMPVDDKFNQKKLVGLPVHDSYGQNTVIGEIVKHMKDKNFVLVKLYEPVNYKFLISTGITMKCIVFPFTA
jgi:hypothetical protein